MPLIVTKPQPHLGTSRSRELHGTWWSARVVMDHPGPRHTWCDVEALQKPAGPRGGWSHASVSYPKRMSGTLPNAQGNQPMTPNEAAVLAEALTLAVEFAKRWDLEHGLPEL